MLKVYNVLNHKKEDFVPQDGKNVKMYACGITASGSAHVGHAYQAVIFDVIRSYMEYTGLNVKYVRNYTDVDDKIIIKARELGVNPTDYAEKIMAEIDGQFEKLGIVPPTICSKATDCIQDMIDFIQKLIDTGHAYPTEYGDVYFKVASYPKYGHFSNRTQGDEMLTAVRKELEPGKLDDRDFALWKHAGDDEIFWESPWGPGRPGWHIECSTMSMKYLGETLDIHGGGKDLIFPHHENEIAQSESLTGKDFSKFWLHNGLVKVNGQKMSKSLNNGILLGDLLRDYTPDVIKITLLQNSYRSDLNIMDGIFDSNEAKIYDTYKLLAKINAKYEGVTGVESELSERIRKEFRDAMDNDFNTALATANLFGYTQEITKLINKNADPAIIVGAKNALLEVYNVIRLLANDPAEVIDFVQNKYLTKNNVTKEEAEAALNEWLAFKANKDFAGADGVRNRMAEKGILLSTDRSGESRWDVKI